MKKQYSVSVMMLLLLVMAYYGGSSNIYMLANTSMPDESVEEEFYRRTNIDNYPIVKFNEKEE